MRALIVTGFWFGIWVGGSLTVTAVSLAYLDFGQAVMMSVLAVLMGSVCLIPMDRVMRQEKKRKAAR